MSKPTNSRKQNLTYYFSVEGETEYWYLKWLEGQIKASGTAKHKITIKPEVAKDPVSYVKKLVIQRKTTIWHLSDIEGCAPGNIQAVQNKGKIGRNQLCPCGSGKKYKKCCGR